MTHTRIGLCALALFGFGCATPISVRIADPREVQLQLTRSALISDVPSDFSLNELRQRELLDDYDRDPADALARLHETAKANGFPTDTLFALAELSFLRAENMEDQQTYTAAMVYAWALLFPEQGRAPLGKLDPRERISADIYNRALTLAFRRNDDGTIALDGAGEIPLPFGHLSVSRAPDLLEFAGMELHSLQPVADIEVKGLRNRYRQPGIGAPLAAKTRPLPDVPQVIAVGPRMRLPLTAVVLIEEPLAGLHSGQLRGRLVLLSSLDAEKIEIDGSPTPLESEPTAALAATLAESQFWKLELSAFLGNALGVRRESALGGVRPYEKGRIPVVFVHGTASSPARWADMINDLLADPRLRSRYAFWLFSYDSGNPVAYSGWQLRSALMQAEKRANPDGTDPCASDMVVMGHSQGGLLTKLTVIDSGDLFWNAISSTPFEQVKLPPDDKELLGNVAFVKPLPFVTEVIFLATPHRGSYLAGPQIVRRLASALVRLPSDVVRIGPDLVKMAPAGATGVTIDKIPTSIDNMSPGNRFIKGLASIPVSPKVRAHSIISIDDPEDPLTSAGDGVVKYESAHIEPVESELIVHSPHSGMQSTPASIEEVRRILLAHSERSKCPVPES